MTMLDSDHKQIQGYLVALGKIVFSFGELEYMLSLAHYSFSDSFEDPDLQQVKLARMQLGEIIKDVRRFVDRLSSTNKGDFLMLLDEADKLKDERNDNIHGAWSIMVDSSNGKFSHVQRYRTAARKGAKRPQWNTTTPSVDALENLSRRASDCATRVAALTDRAYRNDPEFQAWLEAEQSKLVNPISN